MRYEIIPETPQEEAALKRAPHARVLLEPFLPIVKARALMAFVRLGLARALASGSRSPVELASELGLCEDGLRHLLRVLVVTGYVSVERGASKTPDQPGGEERYGLTGLSRTTLLDGCPAQLDAWVLHNLIHWRVISTLEDTLATDGVRDLHHHLKNADEWEVYQRAMLQTARPAAGPIADMIPEPAGRGLLLDLGGSHGLYGAAICRRFPPMQSRVIDLPAALVHARKVGEEEGIGELVEYVEGDVLQAELGEGSCDVVFMGNLVHHLEDAALSRLLHRVYRALRPGGVLSIWDLAPPPDDAQPDLVTAGFSLLFYLSSASACRSPTAHVEALNQAGFVDTDIHSGPSPTHTLVTARR